MDECNSTIQNTVLSDCSITYDFVRNVWEYFVEH